jgi:hypothetical protein
MSLQIRKNKKYAQKWLESAPFHLLADENAALFAECVPQGNLLLNPAGAAGDDHTVGGAVQQDEEVAQVHQVHVLLDVDPLAEAERHLPDVQLFFFVLLKKIILLIYLT